MPPQPTRSDRVYDFIITTIVFTLFNYFDRFSKYTDASKRLWMSFLVSVIAALILAIIKPPIKAWLRARRNRNGDEHNKLF